MTLIASKFLVNTNGNCDIVDLTHKLRVAILENKVNNASVTVHIPFSQAAVGVMEYDPWIIKDFSGIMNKLIPDNEAYSHNIEWKSDCAQAYLKALLIGNSVTVPFVNGEFELDKFQRILLFDFNSNPMVRSVIIQILY